MSNAELIIIADDVTGAADSAARCRQAGLPAAIELFPSTDAAPAQRRPATVWALSTDSRFLQPALAAARVAAIVGNIARHGALAEPTERPIRWYKKIDSTLRGNIGAELAAMLPEVTPKGIPPQAIIAPAFPAQQRALVDGYLRYAQQPPQSLHLPTMLAAQCDLSVGTIALTTVRAGVDQLRQALLESSETLLVVDAESEEDLTRLAIAAAQALPHALYCGSAGLVGILAARLATDGRNPASIAAAAPISIADREIGRHPILIVVGSGSTIAQQQVAHLRALPSVTVQEIDPTIPATMVVPREPMPPAEEQAAQPVIALHLPMPTVDSMLEGPVARQYAAALADVALAYIEQHQPATLLIVGGDTAVHLLQRLGVQQLHVVEELLPGMPVTVGRDRQGNTHRIILKAGNHGDATTVAALLTLS